jgi:hypothetical protein
LASGEVATPTSPIAECLESGAKFKKGTAVVITLLEGSCPEIITLFWARIGEIASVKTARNKSVLFLLAVFFI